jgi:hypothetical protein
MYKIIGADQKEYGPVSIDQLRQWLTEGRLNGETLVRAEGQQTWRPLSSLPEFAGLVPPPQPALGAMPSYGVPVSREDGLRRLNAPGIALLIVGILGLVCSIWNLVATFDPEPIEETGIEALDRFFQNKAFQQKNALTYVFATIPILGSGVITAAGFLMRKGKKLKLAQTASVLAMIPCTASCCCLIGIPVGIWCLVVLGKPEAKALFES